jgi:glycosyltransferase involved in cell wall biosynthesis
MDSGGETEKALRSLSAASGLWPELLDFGEVPVEASYHGSALLYRLLENYPVPKLLVLERSGRCSDPKRRLPSVTYGWVHASWNLGGRFLRLRLRLLLLFVPIWKILARLWAYRAHSQLGGFLPEAILTVQEGTVWLAACDLAKTLKIPCHLIVHDDRLRETPNGWLRRRLEKECAGKRRAVEAADAIICISENTKGDLQARYAVPDSRITVTYLASDLSREISFGPEAVPETPYFLFLGNRGIYKNFARTLLAFSRIADEWAELVLCLVGEGLNENAIDLIRAEIGSSD